MASDGKVVISTALDNSGVKKDLKEVAGEFGGLTKTVKETERAIDKAFSEAGKRKVQLTGFQYDSKEIEKFVNEFVSGLNEVEKHSNGMRAAFDDAKKKVEELEDQGFWWGDEEYEKAYTALDRIKKDIQEAEHFATSQPEPANPFGTDTIAGKIQEAKNQLATLSEAGKGLGDQEYDEAYAALARLTQEAKEYKKVLTETAVPPGLDTYEGKILSLEKALNNLRNAGKGLGDPAYDEVYRKLALARAEAKKYAAELAKTPKDARKAANETKRLAKNAKGSKKEFGALGKSVNSFTSRLKSITMGALLFNGISAGLREFTSYLGTTLKTNKDFTSELSRLKGTLLTAFQPIYNAISPALTYLIRLLTGATLAVAEFFASITGTTIESSAEAAKGLYEEANALESVGKTAEKARKSLAGFDELNVLQDKSESSSSSGNSDVTAPDFAVSDWGTGELEKIKEAFKDIAGYIGVAAAGIAGFKLGSFIADLLTAEKKTKSLKKTITQLGKKAGLVIGVTLAVTGIALETKGIVDAIKDSLDPNSLLDILGGGAAITAGGAMIGQFFGKGVLGGAVGAIVGGIPAYITGIYDACMNGLNWLNGALIAAGSTAAGAGVGAIIGSLGGPITTGIGALIGLATGLITDGILYLVGGVNEQAVPALDVLTEAEKRLVAAADESARKFLEQKDATEKALADITAEKGNAEILADELFKLADASGKVREKDKARAELILGELNRALGTEYEMVGNVIKNYGELKGSIDGVIKSKAANNMLELANADYIAAIQDEDEAWNSAQLTLKDYEKTRAAAEQNIKDWQAELETLHQKQVNGVGLLTQRQNIELSDQMEALRKKIEEEEDQLAKKQAAYEKDRDHYILLQETINKYEAAHEAAMKGNYQTTVDILGGKSQLYTEHAENVNDETAKVLAALEKEAYDAGEDARLTKELFEKGVAGYTEEMVAEAENGYQEALGKWASAYSDAHGLGKDLGQGLADGIEAQNGIVAGAAITQIREAIAAARKEADSHSPSKKTIALGEDIGVGPGIGIENETDSAVKAAENQMDAVIDAYESESAANSGKSFGSTFADGIYSSIKSIATAGSTAAKAAMNAINGAQGVFAIPSWRVSTPKIPHLATGAVLPANKPFLAMVGDQKHGTNIEAPLATIQEAVALVMGDQTAAILAGFEASVGVQREILEAVLGIQIGDDVIGRATARYNSKLAVMRGGV